MNETIKTIQQETANLSTRDLLAYALNRFGSTIGLASSLQAEDQVLTDMLLKVSPDARIFTLDTGRLHQETYDTIHNTNKHYNTKIEILFPDRQAVEDLVNNHGPNSFYDSVDQRKQCCFIRKVEPLQRKLQTLSAWITGQRREQSTTRTALETVQFDSVNNMIKFNPLADWTSEQVWNYIKENNVPYNALHDQGFPSIGCAPCTRAIAPGEDIRAGRWWWEQPQQKECGLHIVDGKLQKKM